MYFILQSWLSIGTFSKYNVQFIGLSIFFVNTPLSKNYLKRMATQWATDLERPIAPVLSQILPY